VSTTAPGHDQTEPDAIDYEEAEMNERPELRERLAGMESRVPASAQPALAVGRRHHYSLSLVAAATLILAAAATAVGGIAVVSGLVRGYPGIENPGQPLAGAQMECMSPPQAATFLAAHGYTDVVWQVESGASKDGSTTFVSYPPAHGYVVPGAILDDGKLHMVVDQRSGARPAGVCGAMLMP
jgi:hypothetical protein